MKKHAIGLFLMCCSFFCTLNAQNWQLDHLLDGDSELAAFGRRVVIDEDIALVGDFNGQVVIFRLVEGNWQEEAVLSHSGSGYVNFGASIAINEDQNVILVGASSANDESGVVYVYERVGAYWGDMLPSAILRPAQAVVGGGFGSSVAISGTAIVVGAAATESEGLPGRAYVFEEPVEGWTGEINEVAELIPSESMNRDWFGVAAAIKGEVVIVGAACFGSTGKAFLFERPDNGWSGFISEATIIEPENSFIDNQFGRFLAFNGETIAISAIGDDLATAGPDYSVFVFEKGADWTEVSQIGQLQPEQPMPDSFFGWSVDLHENRIAVGCWSGTDVYIFDKPEEGWGAMTETSSISGTSETQFGWDVGVWGQRLIIGAPAFNSPNENGKVWFYSDADVANSLEIQPMVNITISPNPTDGVFNISGDKQKYDQIQVISLTGQILATLPATGQERYDLSFLPAGIYWIKVISDDHQWAIRRIIIQR